MTQRFQIHPENPQVRLINEVVNVLQNDTVIVYPTDSAYALGCRLGSKSALEKIRLIRKLDKNHNVTLVCKDLSDLSKYARVDNSVFRLLKAYTPGAYTFILEGSSEVPKRLQHAKRKTIGVRIPKNQIVLNLLEALGEPLLSVTLQMPEDEMPLSDPDDIYDRLKGQIDLLVDGGACGLETTSVIDLTGGGVRVLRQGKGDVSDFE